MISEEKKEELQEEQSALGKLYLKHNPQSKYRESRGEFLRSVGKGARLQAFQHEAWGGWRFASDSFTLPAGVNWPTLENLIYSIFYDGPSFTKDVKLSPEQVQEIGDELGVNLRSTGYIRGASGDVWRSLFQFKQAQCDLHVVLFYLLVVTNTGKTMQALPGYHCCVKVRKGQSVPKAVLKAISKWDVQDVALKQLMEKMMERLGQMWQTQTKEWRVVLSAAPSDFLQLGAMGEGNSCFKAGGAFEKAKLLLMQTPGAVLLKLYCGEGHDEEKGKPDARAWGFWFPGQGMLVSNLYRLEWETAEILLKTAVAQLLDKPVEDMQIVTEKSYAKRLLEEGVYTNGDDRLIGPDIKALEKALFNHVKVLAERRCPSCKSIGEEDDEKATCFHCKKNACTTCVSNVRMAEGMQSLCTACKQNYFTVRTCSHCNEEVVVERHTAGCATCGQWHCAVCREETTFKLTGMLCPTCSMEEREREKLMAEVAAVARVSWAPYEPGCTCPHCQEAFREAVAQREREG